jgi:hypothetical protein
MRMGATTVPMNRSTYLITPTSPPSPEVTTAALYNPGRCNLINLVRRFRSPCPAGPGWMPFRSSSGSFGPALRPGSSTGVVHYVMLRRIERHGPAVQEAENRLNTPRSSEIAFARLIGVSLREHRGAGMPVRGRRIRGPLGTDAPRGPFSFCSGQGEMEK